MDQIGPFIFSHWLLFLSLVIILTLLAGSLAKDRLLGFREIKPADAVEMINHQNAAVLDVREPGEYSGGHILNAVNIPLNALEERLGEIESWRERAVIVCCRSGARAARASALLRRNNFTAVSKLSGGVLAWESAGLPLNKA